MSEKNGDKARFAKQRASKLLRRKRLREREAGLVRPVDAIPKGTPETPIGV